MAKDKEAQKVSIRFYNDREVRAVWSEEEDKWFFSVLDVIGAINEQDDYAKTRNYWKYLKNKLKQEGNEVVSATNQLKLLAPDGKRRLTDVHDAMTQNVADSTHIKQLLQDALTDEINSRKMFMKGIDYSYYYESEG